MLDDIRNVIADMRCDLVEKQCIVCHPSVIEDLLEYMGYRPAEMDFAGTVLGVDCYITRRLQPEEWHVLPAESLSNWFQ